MDATWGTNLLTGSVAHSALRPAGPRRRNKGVVVLPGLGGQAESLVPNDRTTHLLAREYGFSVVSCDVDQLWGNSTQQTRLAELRTDSITAGFIPSGKVHLFGLSMGTCAACMFAAANPTLVASITLLLPAVDLADIYDNDLLNDSGASLEAAYGGEPAATDSPVHATNTAVLSKIPMRVYYTQDDPICRVDPAEDFIAATGAEAVDWGTLGYGFPVGHGVHIDYQDGAEFADWIARND